MEILFNPHHHETFAVTNGDLSFYKLCYGDIVEDEEISVCRFHSKDTDVNTDVKCMAWHPSEECSDIIALGQSNGRVVLKSVEFMDYSSMVHLPKREFFQKHSKQCNALAWNTHHPNWLAVGFDKQKQSSLVVWDVNSKGDFSHMTERNKLSGSELNPSPNQPSVVVKPLVELTPGESVNSLAWIGQSGETSTLIAGFNHKFLRVYDIRSPSSSISSSTINHKATSGICIDPCCDSRIASFGENSVSIWDLRKFVKPVVNIPVNNNIRKVEWSPHRGGMLAVLLNSGHDGFGVASDNDVVYVYELHKALYSDQDLNIVGYQPIVRTVKPKLPAGDWMTWVNGFTWLPVQPNSLLTLSNASSFHVTGILERTSACWNGNRSFSVTSGYDCFYYSHPDNLAFHQNSDSIFSAEFVDVGQIIMKRAKNNYGLVNDNPLKNIELCLEPENIDLHLLWEWIDRINHLTQPNSSTPAILSPSGPQPTTGFIHNKPRSTPRRQSLKIGKSAYFSGVLAVMKESIGDSNTNHSTTETIQWIGVPSTKSVTYTSKKRNAVLSLCDWGSSVGKAVERFGRNSIGEALVRRLQTSGATERACTIAVWHLDLKLAIEILNLASSKKGNTDLQFSAVAMALSGYTGSGSPTLWLDTCRRLQNELKSAYLQMAFAFLIACAEENKSNENESLTFEPILSNKTILVQDRVAFACIYLPDSSLVSYLSRLASDVTSLGTLSGALVTGLTGSNGVQLLQNYVNKTGDMQTALLVIMQTNNSQTLLGPNVLHWKESYCQLLNKWKLCLERSEFDLQWAKASGIQRTTSQVYIHCNYCNKNISSTPAPTTTRGRGYMGGGIGMQSSISSCPSCRKPLPRCSVCSMHLGTRHNETDVSKWTSWCMKCRHGGHQAHLMEWFEKHVQCPVTDCECYCGSDLPTG
ncbi:GATOR2 complex protein MIOS-like isoform X2 [Clavelina lepadiformis]|uniref:GATOR2 complex protein MIOS-like isoform X2 n=1 Tax=Clavelina lepadiformis TaxID=159417 RepID=UPI0040436E62